MIAYFTGKNADFAAGYRINSAIDNTGIRHTGIEGFVTANGVPVAGAKVKLANGKKTVVTDLNGYYSLIKVVPGNYTVEVEANGHGSKTVVYRINRGKVNKLDFELQAAA